MLSRKKPSTPARRNDPQPDEPDTPSPARRRPVVRGRFLRRQPLLAGVWLRFQKSKDDPLMWLVLFFLATLLLAAGTLLDGGLHVGRRALVGQEMEKRETSRSPSTGWTPWSQSPVGKNETARPANIVFPEQSIHPKLRPVSRTAVPRDRHGLHIIDSHEEKKLSVHPITTLIKEAERKAEQMDARVDSIQTFEDAVDDYRRAFGMEPPRGFKKWQVTPSSTLNDLR
jgi:hypothetical protein